MFESERESCADFERRLEDAARRVHLWARFRMPRSVDGIFSAEDVVQESVLRALMGRDRIDPERDLAPWLFGIANNVYRGFLAQQSRRSTVDLSGTSGEILDTSTSISRRVSRSDAVESVCRWGKERDRYDRLLLAFFGGEGLNASQTAAMLDRVAPRADGEAHKPDTCSKHWRSLRCEVVRAIPDAADVLA